MKRAQKRTLKLLLALVAVLAVVLVIVLTVKDRRAKAEAEAAAQADAAGVITEQSAYSALTYDNGDVTLSFALDENGQWMWADDPDFPLDDATVVEIVDLVSALKPQQTITEGDTLEAYGLDEPSATLTATDADGNTLSLSLGNTTTDGDSYYMLMNGEESPVYIIADTLYTYMSKAIYDMCALPTLPTLTADRLVRVTLSGNDQRAVLLAHQPEDGEGDVTWTLAGEDVSDDADVTAVISALAVLTIDKCVDFKPTDEAAAICGFDAPAATVTVAYTTEAGTDGTLTLYLGTETLDGTGRYLRLSDDTTIYQLSTDSATALLGGALLAGDGDVAAPAE